MSKPVRGTVPARGLKDFQGSKHSPVYSNGQQGVGGHVERHCPQVVDRNAQENPMVPGELLNDIVIHQERAAHDRHQEVRHRKVCDEQVGDIAEFFVTH